MSKQIPLNLWGVDASLRAFVSHPVKKHFLEFLAHFPREIQVHGPMCLGDFALALGKCLALMADRFDDRHGSNYFPDVDLGEVPDSINGLAEQFKVIGLRLIEQKPSQLEARVALLQARVLELERHLMPQKKVQIQRWEVSVPEFLKIRQFTAARSHQDDLRRHRRGLPV